MALTDDLKRDIKEILATRWETRDGEKVPESKDIQLGNDAVKLEAAVLYADLAESTRLVDNYKPAFAAEIYKSYLHCATKIIHEEGGEITAFDGDRVMGVFISDRKRTAAATSALRINHAVEHIIKPAIQNQYSDNTYILKHAVGVDISELFIARTGVRGANDLVWVGRAANYAAKLCAIREGGYNSYITEDIYEKMHDEAKYKTTNPNTENMWTCYKWTEKNIFVYRSHYTWGK